jgi:alpha,alpha-trehalose phosphorylase
VSATLVVRGQEVTVTSDDPVSVPLDGQGPRLEGQPEPVPGRRRSDGTVITAIVPGT